MTNQLMQLEEAERLIIENAGTVEETETSLLFHAVGRVVAVDYTAVLDQPLFDCSPLDGYAVRSADIVAASKDAPVQLEVTEIIYAGDTPKEYVGVGKAARIMTGAMIPEGADCVIRQEDVKAEPNQSVWIYMPVRAQQNICKRGEDIKEGSTIIKRGEIITPAHGAVLAGQGIHSVEVYRRVKAAILTTGSELVSGAGETESSCPSGKIYNTNGPMLAMRLAQLGIEAEYFSVSDDLQLIREKIETLSENYDAVITTGGVSVGDKDYMPEVMKQIGANLLFHGVDMKPGTPMLAALYKGKMIYALSGNPFAAAVTAELLAILGLLKTCGLHNVKTKRVHAILKNDFPKASSYKRRFIRARRVGNEVSIPDNHSSGSLFTMIGCDCLVDIPKGSGSLKAGDRVQVVELLTIDAAGYGSEIEPAGERIPVVCICGRKNVGKTTMIEKLLPCLLEKGVRVGVIKHDGHDFVPDVPGTDSARLHAAGAYATAIYSEERQVYYTEQKNVSFEEIKNRLTALQKEPFDLLLVEGLKDSEYDKIEIMRKEISEQSAVHGGKLLAVCVDFDVCHAEKQFSLDDHEQIAQYIIEHYGLNNRMK